MPALARARALLAPCAAVGLFAVVYEAADNSGGLWSTLSLFCGLLVVLVTALRADAPSMNFRTVRPTLTDATYVRVAALVTLLMLPLLLSERPYQRMVIYGEQTGGLSAAVVLIAACAIVCLLKPPPAKAVFGYLLAGTLVLRGSGLDQWEIHPGTRDMLPLIVSACEALLAGENPYRLYAMQIGSEIPLTYPPLLWLTYLPAVAASVDPRWTNWLCDVVVATAIAWPMLVGSGHNQAVGVRTRSAVHASSAASLVVVAAYLFSPDVHWNGVYAESHVDWAMLAVLARSLTMPRTRPITVGVLYGLALLTRPFNVIFLPMLAVYLLRRHGVRRAAYAFSIAGAVAAVGYLPFVLTDPQAFYFGTVHWLLDFGPSHARWFREMIGLSGWLYENEYEHLMPVAQLVIVTAGTCACMLWATTGRRFVAIAMMTYAGFVAFNSLVWMSFWVSVAILASVVATAPSPSPQASVGDDGDPTAARRVWLPGDVPLGLAVTSVLACGALLLALLAGTLRHRGERDALLYATQTVDDGGFWVDWRDFRGALEVVSDVESATDSAPTAALSLWTRTDSDSAHPVDWASHRTVTIVDRYDAVDEDLWASRALAGDSHFLALVGDEQVGDYRVVTLRRSPGERLVRWSEPGTLRVLHVEREGHGAASLESLDSAEQPTGLPNAELVDAPPRHVFPSLPDWAAVGPVDCQVEGAARPMVRAHPLDDGALLLRGTVPAAATVAVVSAALQDGIIEWQRADVLVIVRTAGTEHRLRVPNLRGLRALDLPVQPGDPFELYITTDNDGRRDVCLDVAFWR